jgi:hypothetical protein
MAPAGSRQLSPRLRQVLPGWHALPVPVPSRCGAGGVGVLVVSTPMTTSTGSPSMAIALAPCPDADVVGAGLGPELGKTVMGPARLPRAVRLLHQASSSDRAGAGSSGRQVQPRTPIRVSHSQRHARSHQFQPGMITEPPSSRLTTAPPAEPALVAKMISVCAGPRLGGAPRRNRTGDPILTMEPQKPLCGTPFPQVTPDRRSQSYRFSFGQVMRSLQARLIAAGVGHHPARPSPTQPAFLLIISCSLFGGRLSSPWSTTGRVARRSPPGRPPPRSVRCPPRPATQRSPLQRPQALRGKPWQQRSRQAGGGSSGLVWIRCRAAAACSQIASSRQMRPGCRSVLVPPTSG